MYTMNQYFYKNNYVFIFLTCTKWMTVSIRNKVDSRDLQELAEL